MNTKICPLSRRGFLKGVAIGVGGCALGSSLIHPLEALSQSTAGSLEKIPMEVRWKFASGANVSTAVNLMKYSYDKEGQEKYNERSKIRSLGQGAKMTGLANYLGLTGNDAKSIVVIWSTLIPLWSGPDQKYEIVEATAENARVKSINCVYWNTMQQMKITDDICSVGTQYLFEGFAKAMNAKMTSTLVKARPRGDSVCEWSLQLEV
jgi:hypothetical protein